MACDEGLATRVADVLADIEGVVEKRMFGGIGYLLHGNMACGVNKDDLIIRVGPAAYEESLALPHTKPFDMTGRAMRGWVVVVPAGYELDADLAEWIEKGLSFARTLPAK